MSIHIGWPQAIYLCLVLYGVALAIIKHGEEDTTNAYTSITASILVVALLIWGGFFR